MRFDAPWAKLVKLVSVVASAILLFVAYDVGRRVAGGWLWYLAVVGPLLILAGALLFTVRGYRLEPTRLLVQRLLWSTPIQLAGLEGVRHDPAAMKRSLRLFGNGGMFAIAGLFSNKRLGRYRAFATDPRNSVVLDFGDRKIVVTPGKPEEFLRRLRELRPDLQRSA